MEKVYAQVLWRMVEAGMEPAKAVHALYEKLQSQRREALMPRIGVAFAQIAQRARDHNAITLTVADKKHEATAKKHAVEALGDSAMVAKDMDVRIDPSLIGGWRLEGRERLIDASHKSQLLNMYNRVTK